MTERESPPVKDSDIMWLMIKKLEGVARKMEKLEYDDNLDQMLHEAAEWFDWAAFNIAARSGAPVSTEVDPWERSAIIVTELKGRDGEPASPQAMADAIRAWGRQAAKGGTEAPPTVSETTREEFTK